MRRSAGNAVDRLEKSEGAISNYPHLASAFSQRSAVRLGPIVQGNTKGVARCSYDQGVIPGNSDLQRPTNVLSDF